MAALLFNLAVSLGAAGLFGLWPALRATRVDLHDALKQGGTRGVLGGGRSEWVRGALVSAEVALALVLDAWRRPAVPQFPRSERGRPGVPHRGSSGADRQHPRQNRGAASPGRRDLRTHLRRVARIAGCQRGGGRHGTSRADRTAPMDSMPSRACHDFSSGQFDKLPHAGFRLTSPGYFAAMGVPLIAGRDFDERDLYDAEPVAIVSATLARQVFEGQSPLGPAHQVRPRPRRVDAGGGRRGRYAQR